MYSLQLLPACQDSFESIGMLTLSILQADMRVVSFFGPNSLQESRKVFPRNVKTFRLYHCKGSSLQTGLLFFFLQLLHTPQIIKEHVA